MRPPRRRRDVAERWFGDEVLLVDLRAARQHRLNPTAATVWATVDGRRDDHQIVEAVARAHRSSREVVSAGVQGVLDELGELGLLEPTGVADPEASRPGSRPDPPCVGCGERAAPPDPPDPPDPLARRDPSTPWHHRIGPVQAGGPVGIRTDDDELAERLATALLLPPGGSGDDDAERGATTWCSIVASTPGAPADGWHVELDGDVLVRGADRDRVVAVVLAALVRRFAQGSSGLPLHAAAASTHGRGVVLPGVSGSGKSTLVAELARRGLDYLSDEVVAVDTDTDTVRGLAKAIALDPASITALGLDPALLPPLSGGKHLTPLSRVGATATDRARLELVVLPTYEPGAGVVVDRLQPIDAAVHLVRDTFPVGLDEGGLDAIGSLVERIPCWALRHDAVAPAAGAVAELLDEVRTPARR